VVVRAEMTFPDLDLSETLKGEFDYLHLFVITQKKILEWKQAFTSPSKAQMYSHSDCWSWIPPLCCSTASWRPLQRRGCMN